MLGASGPPVAAALNVTICPTPATCGVAVTLVSAGTSKTSTRNCFVATGGRPLSAVTLRTYCPPEPAAGVPLICPNPLPVSLNCSPCGRVPVARRVGLGTPRPAMLNASILPTLKVATVAAPKLGAAGGRTAIVVLLPVIVALTVSVAKTTLVGGVLSVTLNVPTPLVRVLLGGKTAAASELVKWTVPA